MKKLFVLLAVLALVAAACGSSDEPDTTAAGGTTETTEAAVSEIQAASNACAEGATDGPLNLYNWAAYIPTGPLAEEAELDDLLAKFEEETGESVTTATPGESKSPLPS